MKVVFDTNVYVAEALGGETGRRIIDSTQRAAWHILVSQYIVDELFKVMTEDLGLPRRNAALASIRAVRRARLVEPARHRAMAFRPTRQTPLCSKPLARRERTSSSPTTATCSTSIRTKACRSSPWRTTDGSWRSRACWFSG